MRRRHEQAPASAGAFCHCDHDSDPVRQTIPEYAGKKNARRFPTTRFFRIELQSDYFLSGIGLADCPEEFATRAIGAGRSRIAAGLRRASRALGHCPSCLGSGCADCPEDSPPGRSVPGGVVCASVTVAAAASAAPHSNASVLFTMLSLRFRTSRNKRRCAQMFRTARERDQQSLTSKTPAASCPAPARRAATASGPRPPSPAWCGSPP